MRGKFNSHPFAYHQEIELPIDTLTNQGVGLGRIDGWVVMVPFTLPGEQVRARVFRNHKNYSEADAVGILTPSPHRQAAPCPLFGRCGGCQYQHFAYTEQLVWKRRQVEELLQHLAGLAAAVDPVVPSPREFGYRSKITPHFQAPRGGTGGPHRLPEGKPVGPTGATPALRAEADAFPIGFLRQGTRFDLVDVPQCPIATPAINARLTEVRANVRAKAAAGGYTNGATVLLREASGAVCTDFDAEIAETIDLDPPLRLRFLARDFFQNNPFILPAFVAHVRDEARAGGARFLVDAYCGSGLFALSAARHFETVAGVELSASSVAFARRNAADNGIANAVFHAADASAIFASIDFPAPETAVIIDPPRRGCDETFLRQLFAFGPARVVYVSCDPATQMRDLRHFTAAGYAPTRVRPFDLFPQTRHLECVISLALTALPDGKGETG